MKICKHCGTGNGDTNKFCVGCGAPLEDVNANASGAQGWSNGGGYGQAGAWQPGGTRNEQIIYTSVAPRSIAMAIILSIVTCGIYMFYWIYKLNNEVNELAEDPNALGGGMVVFLSIITCGIYYFYWLYKMGQKCDYISQTQSHNAILFLVLGIFGLGIVSVALIQDTINKALE